jgi:hypothetical protein
MRLVLFALVVLLVLGCENVDVSKISDSDMKRIADNAIVCNSPYIRFDTGCCLDQNSNAICDNDESSLSAETTITHDVEKRLEEYSKLDCETIVDRTNHCKSISQTVNTCLVKYGGDAAFKQKGLKLFPKSDKTCYEIVLCSDFINSTQDRTSCFPPKPIFEKCTLPSGVACLDFAGTTSTVTLVIQNSAGFDMTGVSVYVNSTTADFACTAAGDTILTDGEKETYTCATGGLSTGAFRGTLNIDYTNSQTTISHTKSGELVLII